MLPRSAPYFLSNQYSAMCLRSSDFSDYFSEYNVIITNRTESPRYKNKTWIVINCRFWRVFSRAVLNWTLWLESRLYPVWRTQCQKSCWSHRSWWLTCLVSRVCFFSIQGLSSGLCRHGRRIRRLQHCRFYFQQNRHRQFGSPAGQVLRLVWSHMESLST